MSSENPPSLSLWQMLTLADRGWSDGSTLMNLVKDSTSRRTRSPFLIFASLLITTAFIIPVLHGAFQSTEHIKVFALKDQLTRVEIGSGPSPGALAGPFKELVLDSVIAATINSQLTERQSYLWSSIDDNRDFISLGSNILNQSSFEMLPTNLHIATFPVGTDGGVVRNLAFRLNIYIACNTVPQSDFPATCSGDEAFNVTYSNIDDLSRSAPFGDYNGPRYRARIYAPSNSTKSPWRPTDNSQHLHEEVWIDYQHNDVFNDPFADLVIDEFGGNYTQHCYSDSALGYFELPNYWNGHVAGPLLHSIPLNSKNLSYANVLPQPLRYDPGADVDDPGKSTPGPLLSAINAIFGPNTFFNIAATNSFNYTSSTRYLCSQLRYPFTGVSFVGIELASLLLEEESWNQTTRYLDCSDTLLDALMKWMPNFGDPFKATAALTLATYAAGNTILNLRSTLGEDLAANIDSVTGTDIQRPHIPLAAMIIITILYIIQLVGLSTLAIYASKHPTWTASLDAWAMLRIGAELGLNEVPALGAMEAKEAGMLEGKAGWVGDTGTETEEKGLKVRKSVLGGTERVRGGVLYRMMREKERGLG